MPYSGIVERFPDLLPILREAGFTVVEIPNRCPETIRRSAEINVHPKFTDVETLHLG